MLSALHFILSKEFVTASNWIQYGNIIFAFGSCNETVVLNVMVTAHDFKRVIELTRRGKPRTQTL